MRRAQHLLPPHAQQHQQHHKHSWNQQPEMKKIPSDLTVDLEDSDRRPDAILKSDKDKTGMVWG